MTDPAPAPGTPAIQIRDLHKSFGSNEVLKGIDFHVDDGEVVCVIGPSGSGKSTLLRCVNLLEQPDSGQVLVEGIDITDPETDLDAVRSRIGMVFQQFNLFPHMNVLRNLTVAQEKVKGRSKKEAVEVARTNLDKVAVGVDINATHHRSATSGTVTGVATAIHLGRTSTAYDIVITDERGKRVCTSRITCALLDAPKG